MTAVAVAFSGMSADAAGPAPVDLGSAAAFAVLAGSGVTNTGPTTVNGDLGLSPGTSVTGFPPGEVNGTIHVANEVAAQAQADLTDAYNDAAGRISDSAVSGDIGGLTLTPGVYTSGSSLGLTGTLTLDAQNDENAVFIFQVGSTLTTASGSQVSLIGGANACNVFWQVGSSTTLGTNSVFRGTILALTSITATTGTVVDGRTLARNGATTLDTDTITRATCPSAVTTTTIPGTETTDTTVPGTETTDTTVPGTETTDPTRPAQTTDTTRRGTPTTDTTGPDGPFLARTGTGRGDGLALLGVALTMMGGASLLVARRRESAVHRT